MGNQNYQHLVKYSKVTILFYAMINNSSADISLPISQTMALLTKYGLDKVTYTNEGSFTSYDDLCDKLLNLYKEVAESSIHSEEEGSVLYFIGNFQTPSEKVLSLCKLKTLEYRVLRKLREKLRNFVDACNSGKGNTDV